LYLNVQEQASQIEPAIERIINQARKEGEKSSEDMKRFFLRWYLIDCMARIKSEMKCVEMDYRSTFNNVLVCWGREEWERKCQVLRDMKEGETKKVRKKIDEILYWIETSDEGEEILSVFLKNKWNGIEIGSMVSASTLEQRENWEERYGLCWFCKQDDHVGKGCIMMKWAREARNPRVCEQFKHNHDEADAMMMRNGYFTQE